MSTRRIHSDDVLVSRTKALLRKHGGPDPDAQAAKIERLTRERDALRSEVENLKNWREDAEKYIESLTTMVVKQRDRAEKAEELLRAYEAVVIRREEDGNSR